MAEELEVIEFTQEQSDEFRAFMESTGNPIANIEQTFELVMSDDKRRRILVKRKH